MLHAREPADHIDLANGAKTCIFNPNGVSVWQREIQTCQSEATALPHPVKQTAPKPESRSIRHQRRLRLQPPAHSAQERTMLAPQAIGRILVWGFGLVSFPAS
jgi:hypothetical protein